MATLVRRIGGRAMHSARPRYVFVTLSQCVTRIPAQYSGLSG